MQDQLATKLTVGIWIPRLINREEDEQHAPKEILQQKSQTTVCFFTKEAHLNLYSQCGSTVYLKARARLLPSWNNKRHPGSGSWLRKDRDSNVDLHSLELEAIKQPIVSIAYILRIYGTNSTRVIEDVHITLRRHGIKQNITIVQNKEYLLYKYQHSDKIGQLSHLLCEALISLLNEVLSSLLVTLS